MSVVTLQLGQCGNQVGREFYDLLSKSATRPNFQHPHSSHGDDYFEMVTERFFDENSYGKMLCRAVMVDTEQKVISQMFEDTKAKGTTWSYRRDGQVSGKRGSGNNWALGYCFHGQNCVSDVLEAVSKEVEKCDSLGCFLTLMSVAGGTGSGLGTFLTTAIKDEFPHVTIINNAIWPYTMGEVIIQNYNAVLTLSHLYSSSDAIIFMENDKMQQICTQLLKIKNVSFKDINKVIAMKLAGVCLPASLAKESKYLSKFCLADILSNTCSHPGYKLLNILNIPIIPKASLVYTSYNWSMLVKHARQMLISDAKLEEGINWSVKVPESHQPIPKADPMSRINKSVANQTFLRGKDSETVDLSPFRQPQLYANWIPKDKSFHNAHQRYSYNDTDQSLTLLSNSQSPVKPLNTVISKAWKMFSSRAYIHQYIHQGIVEDDFLDSFITLEQVVKNYASL